LLALVTSRFSAQGFYVLGGKMVWAKAHKVMRDYHHQEYNEKTVAIAGARKII